MAEQSDSKPESSEGERPLSDSLREAVEGAFAATGLTRDRAQELTGRTRDRAQDLVGEVSRMGQDAREALESLKLVGRDEFEALVEQVERLEKQVTELVDGVDKDKKSGG